ncbi:phosphopyruvate hydratase [Candidatus Woesearchaeota archaeon]|nr:phosphopyruvate hydratase [Candidatus Woesearchaeota archaeon]RLE43739.1 MAG: phosphopyruvate hydratase [Candidatus Woesearchaeota archaeon]
MVDYVIRRCFAREVLDSRGNPTVEVEMHTRSGYATAMVPSGASTGKHEALELRDNNNRYMGKGVRRAIANVDLIAKKLVGSDVREQRCIDQLMINMDGTPNKSKLGANAILGVSMCAARLAAQLSGKPLYQYLAEFSEREPKMAVPFANIINGGAHAGNHLKIQEFMIVPQAETFAENMRIVSEVYHTLKKILKEEYGLGATNVGDEGGFAPPIATADEALGLIERAIEDSGHADRVKLAIDAAASYFYIDGKYELEQTLTPQQLADYWEQLVAEHNLISLEDPFAEDDYDGFQLLMQRLGNRLQIVGDDLLVTNVKRIKMAITKNLCNALLLKLNQIGTVTEAIEAAHLAFANNWGVMVSHRSGETEDTFIADLAVALGCGQIKLGAPCRSERTAKYNRLLRISEQLSNSN